MLVGAWQFVGWHHAGQMAYGKSDPTAIPKAEHVAHGRNDNMLNGGVINDFFQRVCKVF